MSNIIETLTKRSSIFIIITGVALLIIGAAGQITFGTLSLKLSNTITQWVIIVTSLMLIIIGTFIEIRGGNINTSDYASNFGLFTSETDTFANLKIESRIASAKSIELLGYNLKSLLQEFREPLAKAIIRGAFVRILLVDTENNNTQEMFKQHSNRPHLMLPEWSAALEHVNDINKILRSAQKVNGKFEVKLTAWIPSTNLIIFNADDDSGIMKVGIHTATFRQPVAGRVSIVLARKSNSKAFEYFAKGFDLLWEKDSKEWNGIVPSYITQTS